MGEACPRGSSSQKASHKWINQAVKASYKANLWHTEGKRGQKSQTFRLSKKRVKLGNAREEHLKLVSTSHVDGMWGAKDVLTQWDKQVEIGALERRKKERDRAEESFEIAGGKCSFRWKFKRQVSSRN